MAYPYLQLRFGGSAEATESFCLLLKPEQIALTGSSIIQIRLGVVWEDSFLDVVIAAGENSDFAQDRLDLIYRLTLSPLNYETISDQTQFHQVPSKCRIPVRGSNALRPCRIRRLLNATISPAFIFTSTHKSGRHATS